MELHSISDVATYCMAKLFIKLLSSLVNRNVASVEPLVEPSVEPLVEPSVEPSYRNLLSYFEHVDNWRLLGSYLLPEEYTPRLLNDIERSYNGRVGECRAALLTEYLKVGEVSWSKVISSLEKSNFSNVVKMIKTDIFHW